MSWKEEKAEIERKINNQRKHVVGDLVMIAPWCKNKNRVARVVNVFWWDEKLVEIQYMDQPGLGEGPSRAATGNLIILE